MENPSSEQNFGLFISSSTSSSQISTISSTELEQFGKNLSSWVLLPDGELEKVESMKNFPSFFKLANITKTMDKILIGRRINLILFNSWMNWLVLESILH